MERDWLIRTSQNQILGPVAKVKLLEFIQKGALGMTDEVACGNGYWFSLKEKNLVEKYIYGDLPQGYNPISESKSILARRENPDKTSSINNAPANRTQVLSMSNLGPSQVPKSEDLEFPDISPPIAKSAGPIHLDESERLKLPTNDDLEFPDMAAITSNVNQSFNDSGLVQSESANLSKTSGGHSPKVVAPVVLASSDDFILPNEDDLAFPDLESFEDKTSTKVEKGHVDLDHQYTRTVALDNQQAAKILPDINDEKAASSHAKKIQESLEVDFEDMSLSLNDLVDTPAVEEPAPLPKKERKPQNSNQNSNQNEDKKLLHERKMKSSSRPAAQRDPSREVAHKDDQAEPLKKRNDNYIFFILIILFLIIVAVFFYFKEILNKPLPV